jgi:hypothetical protein
MLSTKEDYFARSREQHLPNRCPILNRCARRFATIELVNEGVDVERSVGNPQKPEVPISGTGPLLVGRLDDTHFVIDGVCPEVALFETAYFLMGLSGKPLIKARYDKYANPQDEVLETGHFSECAEYALATTDPTLVTQQIPQPKGERQILTKLDELLMAVQQAKLDEAAKQVATTAIEKARSEPSPLSIRGMVQVIGPLASLTESGSKLLPHLEALGRLITSIWP